MARKPRIHYQGAFYHVIVRGNNLAYILRARTIKKSIAKSYQNIRKDVTSNYTPIAL
ncbi:MAG: hypothetical protein U9N03_03095 [Candidatus Caldatribacteriota bacterium]|nr:hypothetical protein [Candidatus Caldatribacteriota bacterium]